MTFGPGNISALSVTVNSGAVLDSPATPLQVTKQPLVPFSGVLQPLPPLFGFRFPGTALSYALANSEPYDICAAADGNLWVADYSSTDNAQAGLWRVTPDGVSTRFQLGANSDVGAASCVCYGPDNNIWVGSTGTGDNGPGVWQVALDGTILNFFPLGSGPYGNALTNGCCAGLDGNVWFTDGNNQAVWRVTPDGTATQFLGTEGTPERICVGPTGLLYVSIFGGGVGSLWGVEYDGTISQIQYSDSSVEGLGICVGADGNLWVVDQTGDAPAVWRVTVPDGIGTSFALSGAHPGGICAGGGGDLWVADTNGAIWQVTTEGTATSFVIAGNPGWICVGADGSFWLRDATNAKVWVEPFTVLGGQMALTAGDVTFDHNTQGPVIVDQADGHTYRVISTAGVLSTQEVT